MSEKHFLYDYLLPIESGLRPAGGVNTEDGDVPSLGGENIKQEGGMSYDSIKLIPRDFYDKLNRGLLQDGDVLINKDGANTGKVGIYKPAKFKEAAINEHLFLMRGVEGVLNQHFLYYSLLSDTGQKIISNQITGTAQPGLNSSFILKYPFSPPRIQIQDKIAQILSTADAVIEKTQAAIAKYKAIKQGMLQDLFTRGIDLNTNKLRPRYEDAPELYKDSKLGWIPREWEDKSIESIGEIVTGSTPPTARAEYYGDAFLFVSPADIQDNFFIQETGKKLTQSGFDVTRKLPVNSICVVCIGSTIGKMALLAKEGCTNQQINSVICHDPELSFYFFYAMMFYNEPQFRRETGLQAVPIVNKSQFSEFLLPVAEKTEALKIAERLKAIDNKLQTELTYLQKMQSLKKGLMEDLLSGRKQVKVAEEVLTQSEN